MSDIKNIETNFKTFQDDKIVSLIIAFPILSKYFYKKMHYQDLVAISLNNEMISPEDKLNQKQISFLLYTQEIKDLIEWARAKQVKLIFITTPINSSVPPKEVCAHANTPSITEKHQEIAELLKSGQVKEAYNLSKGLAEITKTNAMSYYLLGKSAGMDGNHKVARMAYQKAFTFDCLEWRGNAVYNAIMLKEAIKKQIPVIDFDLEISSNSSPETTFIDDIYPQNIYYQGLAKELDETIRQLTRATK